MKQVRGDNADYKHVSDSFIDSLQKQLEITHSDSVKIHILHSLTELLFYDNTAKALTYAKKGISLCEKTNDNYTKAQLLNRLGIIYRLNADYSNATFYFFQAIKLFEVLNNKNQYDEDLSACYNNVGLCYIASKQYDRAKKYLLESLRLVNTDVGANNNLGMLANLQGKTEEGLFYIKTAFALSNYTNGMICNNIGSSYLKLDQLDSAERYFRQALPLSQENAYYYTTFCFSLGEFYVKQNKFDSAEKYLFMAKQVAESSGVKVMLTKIYETIASMYIKQNDYVNAYKYKEKFYKLEEAEVNATVTKQINELHAKYELEKKDKDIQILHKDKEIAQNKMVLRNVLIGGLICILIIGIIITRNIVLKQRLKAQKLNEEKILVEKNNQLLRQYNKELSKENVLAKYEILKSKINPHFLFNSLTTLSSIVIENPRQAVTYIENFSELYRLILETGEHQFITLKQEVEILEHYIFLQKIRFDTQLQITIEINEQDMYKMVPPFAIQMLVENAIKHNKVSKGLVIIIKSDKDGLWISNNTNKKTGVVASTGTGHKNIADRYKMVGSRLPKFILYDDKYVVNLPLISKTVTTMQTMDS